MRYDNRNAAAPMLFSTVHMVFLYLGFSLAVLTTLIIAYNVFLRDSEIVQLCKSLDDSKKSKKVHQKLKALAQVVSNLKITDEVESDLESKTIPSYSSWGPDVTNYDALLKNRLGEGSMTEDQYKSIWENKNSAYWEILKPLYRGSSIRDRHMKVSDIVLKKFESDN